MRVWLAIGLFLGLGSAALAKGSLPVVSPPPGSHYEVMKAVGMAMKSRMQDWISTYTPLEDVLRPWTSHGEGADALAAFIGTNRAAFPSIWDELRGLADGSGISMDTIVLMELRVELLNLARRFAPHDAVYEVNQECSDMFASGGNDANDHGQWHAHNEDSEPGLKNTGFIVNATFLDDNGIIDSGYLAFHYPTSTIGHAFGFNIHGISVTENSVEPKKAPIPGSISTFFLARHVADATSFEDALRRARLADIPGNYTWGASLNVASLHEGLAGNVEVTSGGAAGGASVSVVMVGSNDTLSHFNMLRHSKVPQVPQESSLHRLKKADELLNAANGIYGKAFVASVVSDTTDTAYPVYRTNSAVESAATAIFDNTLGQMEVWWNRPARPERPGGPLIPDLRFDMKTRMALDTTLTISLGELIV